VPSSISTIGRFIMLLLLTTRSPFCMALVTRASTIWHRPLMNQRTLFRRNFAGNSEAVSEAPSEDVASLAIVGGGLAGLATCHSWLKNIAAQYDSTNNCKSYRIVIYDTETRPGVGGASAVAGGLIHPLSPRGKLVYRGLEGLEASNQLIDSACQTVGSSSVVLSNAILRCAQTSKHVEQLQKTARELPELFTWLDPADMSQAGDSASSVVGEEEEESTAKVLGALRMSNGCRVIHVPSYLQGLYLNCQQSVASMNKVSLEWKEVPSNLEQVLDTFDTVIFSAGAAIFQDYLPSQDADEKDQNHVFPVHLLRGQSIEFVSRCNDPSKTIKDAFLCGKYISPLPSKNGTSRVLVGATHEFKKEASSQEDVVDGLKSATQFMAPHLWDESEYAMDRITSGYRVQSQRGHLGRLPLLGKMEIPYFLPQHDNVWIYTGLSSRGLLYHALFADILVSAAWNNNEELIKEKYPELLWWKKAVT